jgi:hypothetical protein
VKLDPKGHNLPWIVLVTSLVVCFGVWHWAEVILAPANTHAAQSKGIPIGNNSDLYPRWLGTRGLLLHGRDPYSAEMTREIQVGFYGRALDPLNPHDPPFTESFVYPLYVVFLMAPAAALPFRMAVYVFQWLLLFALALSVPLWMFAVGFRPRGVLVISGMVLVVSTFPAVLEFHQQNLAALVILFLAAAAAAAVHDWLVLSGFLLALATTKPDISSLVIIWLLLWAIGRWPERKRLVWSFVGTMAALLFAAEIIFPHWIGEFLMAVREYPTYGADPPILQLFLPSPLAKLIEGVLICILCLLCWRWRKAAAGSEYFGWSLAWVTAVTIAIIPKLAAYNQPLLIPAILVLLAQREKVWHVGPLTHILVISAFGCQVWQWITALVLSLASLVFPVARLYPGAEVPEYASFSLSALTLAAVVAATFSLRHASDRTIPRIPAVPHG